MGDIHQTKRYRQSHCHGRGHDTCCHGGRMVLVKWMFRLLVHETCISRRSTVMHETRSRMPLSRRSGVYAFAIMITILYASAVRADAGRPGMPALVEEVLWWLPDDTEMIMVAQGPFNVADLDPRGAGMKDRRIPSGCSRRWAWVCRSLSRNSEIARSHSLFRGLGGSGLEMQRPA